MPRCNYLYNHLAIVDNQGFVNPCCIFQRKNQNTEYSTIYELDINLNKILTSQKWSDLREQMNLNDFIPECLNCSLSELSNIESKRQYYNNKSSLDLLNFDLEDLEIALDYTCNMMCRICDPGQSSKWKNAKSLLEKLSKINPIDSKIYKTPNDKKNYANKIKEVISNTDFSKLKRVNIVGGEPFYSKNLKYFLEKIDNNAGIENIEISFNTNASIFPNDDVLSLLLKAKKILIRFSLDAIGDLASVIRHGVEWSVIDETIKKWSKYSTKPNLKFVIHTTISVLNVNVLQKMIDYSFNNNIDLSVYDLKHPTYLSIYQIPVSIREKWLVKPAKKNNGPSILIAKRINQILTSSFNLNESKWINKTENFENNFDYTKFLSSTEALDNYHNNSFDSVNHEIVKVFNKLRKKNK
jgi:molybdenum cofactor biosynthesis enzyme MoaA